MLVTGCSASSPAASKPLTARQALTVAVSQSQQVRSLAETLNVQVAGTTSGSTTGTIQLQLKPTLLIGAVIHVIADGQQTPVQEILTSKAIYLKIASLSGVTGKPWVKVDLSALSSGQGAAFGQLLQNLQNSNPLSQIRLLTVAKNLRAVGTQVVDGVQTTEYTGSYAASAALADMSPSLRTALGSYLKTLGSSTLRFRVWIDAQHQLRKVVDVVTVAGQTVTTTVNITAINQSVNVTLPPASQVASPPSGG
jgi:hypothetical protein